MNREFFISLMYHNVLPSSANGVDERWLRRLSPSITSYFVDDDSFAKQMLLLANTADCLDTPGVDALFSRDMPPASAVTTRPRVNVTFDDGWQGCVTHGGPILEQFGWRATIFVTTSLIGRPGFLTRGELQRIPASVFDVGSHTVTHCFLNEQSTIAIYRELSDSRAELEDLLGRGVRTLSIPNGAVDERVREIAVDAGYRLLFTSEARGNSPDTGPLNIGRIPVRHNTSPRRIVEYGRGRLGRQSWRRSLLRLPKQLLGPSRYRTVRRMLLGERPDQWEMAELAAIPAENELRPDGQDVLPPTQSFVPPTKSN